MGINLQVKIFLTAYLRTIVVVLSITCTIFFSTLAHSQEPSNLLEEHFSNRSISERKAIQNALYEADFYFSDIDGKWGRGTETAVLKALQLREQSSDQKFSLVSEVQVWRFFNFLLSQDFKELVSLRPTKEPTSIYYSVQGSETQCSGSPFYLASLMDDMSVWQRSGEGMACQLINPTQIRGLDAQLFDVLCADEGFEESRGRYLFSFHGENLTVISSLGTEYFSKCEAVGSESKTSTIPNSAQGTQTIEAGKKPVLKVSGSTTSEFTEPKENTVIPKTDQEKLSLEKQAWLDSLLEADRLLQEKNIIGITLKGFHLGMGASGIHKTLTDQGYECDKLLKLFDSYNSLTCKTDDASIILYPSAVEFSCSNFNTCDYGLTETAQLFVDGGIVSEMNYYHGYMDATTGVGIARYSARGPQGDELVIQSLAMYGNSVDTIEIYLRIGSLGSKGVEFD